MPYTVNVHTRIHWTSQGSGEPVVLLHGLGGEIDFFTNEIAGLSRRFRVIAIDIRGSGGTPANGGHTMDDLADDVCAVLDDAGARRAHVLGFSMGGNVAQSFAVRHPDRLDKLILAATFAVMNPQARLFLDAVQCAFVESGSQRRLFDLVCPWLFSIGFLADAVNADHLTYPDAGDVEDQSVEAWTAQYAAQRRFDGRAALSTITAPTLVIGGGEDALVSVRDLDVLAAGVPNSVQIVLPGVGHLLNVEAPALFLETVIGFLAD